MNKTITVFFFLLCINVYPVSEKFNFIVPIFRLYQYVNHGFCLSEVHLTSDFKKITLNTLDNNKYTGLGGLLGTPTKNKECL